jgi:hypothetical protein
MATITTKYGVGDVVWHAGQTTTQQSHPCPDCLGSREWIATSPAGGKFPVSCPRCSTSYQANHKLSIKYAQWTPTTNRRTIGSVRADTYSDRGAEYMCHETGVGSGSIYYEKDLFETQEAALAAALARCAVSNADQTGWVAKQFEGTAEFCDYQLKDAAIGAVESQVRELGIRIRCLLEDIEDAETIGEVRDAVTAWREEAA